MDNDKVNIERYKILLKVFFRLHCLIIYSKVSNSENVSKEYEILSRNLDVNNNFTKWIKEKSESYQ